MHNLCEDVDKLTKDSTKAKEFFMSQLAFTITVSELKELLEKELNEVRIFDVRDYEDYLKGHIPYAVHIPLQEINNNLEQFEKDKLNVFYGCCALCDRGKKASLYLADKNYTVKELKGGFKGWKKSGYEIIKDVDSANFE